MLSTCAFTFKLRRYTLEKHKKGKTYLEEQDFLAGLHAVCS
jgi:hypothetical protein